MESQNIIPDEILREQVCHECFQYLSVPSTVISRQGEVYCGRCCDSNESKRQHTQSLYNVVAEWFLFKCSNHLNGCNEILTLGKKEKHEDICSYKYQEECFFCSFSGHLTQIINHSWKTRNKHIILDGIISFSLNDDKLNKNLLYILKDNVFMVNFQAKLEFLILKVKKVNKSSSTIVNQFAVKIFKPEEPLNFELVHTDYAMLNINFESYFKKSKEELASIFGSEGDLCCQILIDSFVLDTKELEFQKRYERLRHAEEDMRQFKRKIESREQKLSTQSVIYEDAIKIIKLMSHAFFRCSNCQKANLSIIFVCPKIHCYCKDCLTNFCKICNTQRVFKRLKSVENFNISCDWSGCDQNLELKDYARHQIECSQRQYKCPLQDCNEIIRSAEQLVKHWHIEIPRLYVGEYILYEKYDCEELFWLLENDLYRVLVKFDAENLEILIEEISVLSNDRKLKCLGFVPDCLDDICWHNITSTDFCGKFQVNMKNSLTIQNQSKLDEVKQVIQIKIINC